MEHRLIELMDAYFDVKIDFGSVRLFAFACLSYFVMMNTFEVVIDMFCSTVVMVEVLNVAT